MTKRRQNNIYLFFLFFLDVFSVDGRSKLQATTIIIILSYVQIIKFSSAAHISEHQEFCQGIWGVGLANSCS